MANITQLPAQADRVETGPVQFGDDWPGVFIRGDRAGWLALQLDAAKSYIPEAQPFLRLELQGLINLLGSCVAGPAAQEPEPALPQREKELPQREKELLVEYAVRDLRGLEQNGQLRTVKGTPFKTAAAARAYRAKMPAGTEFDPARFGVYAVEGGFVLRRYEREGLGWGAVDPGWVGGDAAETERQRTARRAAFKAARNLTEDEHGNFVELEEQ